MYTYIRQEKRVALLILVLSLFLLTKPFVSTDCMVFAHSYSSDYRFWNQGQSDYGDMRGYGCLVVAQAKMLKNAGVNISNPDAWYNWLLQKRYLINMYMQDHAAPQYYANSVGVKLKYLGNWPRNDSQIWYNINTGYYTILDVGGHFVIVDNSTSKANGDIYIWDSWSSSYNGKWCSTPIRYKSKYGGTGSVGAHTFSLDRAPVKPAAPTNVKFSNTNIGIGDSLSVSWNKSSGATKYNVSLVCTSNSSYNQSKSVTGTSASFKASHAGNYQIKVSASNAAGTSSATTSSNSAVVHKNCIVKYVDWDGQQIGATQSIKYGGNSTPPTTPKREGYTFQKWSSDGKNIKSDTTITAQYKINSYSVSFLDYNGNVIGSVQKVDYKSAAIPPTDVPVKEGYVFTGWSSDEYKEVKRALTVKAVYVWENVNLPIITRITSATRNAEGTGYNITVKMSNFPNNFTKGKLVAALKTKDGKMVASETKSVSMPSTGETTETMTILYSGLASKVDVSMVGVIDDETTGTPKSKAVTASVDLGNEWSDWSTTTPEGDDIIKESRTEYRYKTRKIIKDTSTPATPSGFTLTSTTNTGTYSPWGEWTDWSQAAVTKTTLRDVGTTTGYRYYAFQCSYCGTRDPYTGACSKCGKNIPSTNWKVQWGTCKGQEYNGGYTKIDNNKGRIYWRNAYWYFEFPGTSNGEGGTGQPTTKLYRYRTRQEYKNYTYWSTNWSEWSPAVATASDDKRVETRTVYRFKNNGTDVPCYNYKRYRFENLNTGKTVYTYTSAYADSMGFPGQWEYNVTYAQLSKVNIDTGDDVDLYGGTGENSWYKADVNEEGDVTEFETVKSLEDSLGTKRTLEGTIDNAAGKVATLMIYKGNNDDPTASQIEYIGQTTIGDDGSYSFEYITKEEPTIKTGDFVITLGVEGSTNYKVLGKIEAPKPVCYVNFVDDEGNAIGEQKTVVSGGEVEAPEPPEKEGYDFLCWDTGLKNITENIVITAQYRKKIFTVIFVDWNGQSIDVKEFEYGDVLSAETVPECEGKVFTKWIDENDQEVLTVTEDMIVSADYTDAYHTIRVEDWDGNTIQERTVQYGDNIEIPEGLEAPSENEVFSKWDRADELSFVRNDIVLSPIAKFANDSSVPDISVKTGTYAQPQTVTIDTNEEDGKVFYSVQPIEDAMFIDTVYENEYQEYTSEFVVQEDSAVFAFTKSRGKNNSVPAISIISFGENDENIAATIEAINSIPDIDSITLDNEGVINSAKELYDGLDSDQQSVINTDLVEKLNAAINKIAELKEAAANSEKVRADKAAAQLVTDKINALPDTITKTDEPAITAAREAYDSLTEDQQQYVTSGTYKKLVDSEKAYNAIIAREQAEQEAQEASRRAVENVKNKINALPDLNQLSLSDEADVQVAKELYEALTDDEKQQVGEQLVQKLNSSVYRMEYLKTYDEEESNKTESDQEAADFVIELIRALPAADEVDWDNDHEQIERAKAEFDKLLPEQQDLIPYSVYNKLESVYDALMEQDPRAEQERQRAERQNTVNTVISLIESIPDSADLKLSDKSLVTYARERFDALTDEELELITLAKYRSCENKLSNAETKIRELEEAAEQTTVYLTGITATKTKREFSIGEKITTDDISVKASYSNGSSKNVSNFDTNVIDIDMSSSGQKTLVVSYKENGITMTASIAITVKDVAIMPIVLEIEGNTIYYVGQYIDLDEFTVKAHYSDGSSKKISNSPYQQNHYTTNINDIDMSISGSKDLVFTYTENGKTITKAVAITIKKKINIKNATIKGVHNVVYNKNTGAMERNYIDDIEVWYNGERLIKEDDVDFDDDYDYGTFCYCEDVGKGEITIYGEGIYTGTVTKYFKVLPRGTSLSKLSKRRKSMKVTWKKQAMKMSYSRITGYQIRYSTSSKMKKARTTSIKGYKKTSKVIKNLKSGKKYYVQIRTYKKVNGKNYYSKWSSKMSVKVK